MEKMKSDYIWHNGKYIKWDESNDHSVIHGLHYGTSAFEGIRFYMTQNGPKIFRLAEHISRLFYSAKTIDMELPYTQQELINACIDLIKTNNLENGYIRPIVYYGYGKMGLSPKGAKINVSISAWKWGKYLSSNPIKIGISKYKRIPNIVAPIDAKLGGYYVTSALSHSWAEKHGFQEALLLDINDNIAEGPGENIFFIKDNTLYTPSLGNILPGITRDSIIQIAQEKLGINTIETEIKESELSLFDEAFFCGTAAEVTPIGTITDSNGDTIQYKNDLTDKIGELYIDIATGKLGNYNNWLY